MTCRASENRKERTTVQNCIILAQSRGGEQQGADGILAVTISCLESPKLSSRRYGIRKGESRGQHLYDLEAEPRGHCETRRGGYLHIGDTQPCAKQGRAVKMCCKRGTLPSQKISY